MHQSTNQLLFFMANCGQYFLKKLSSLCIICVQISQFELISLMPLIFSIYLDVNSILELLIIISILFFFQK
jgi:hypothetical protein